MDSPTHRLCRLTHKIKYYNKLEIQQKSIITIPIVEQRINQNFQRHWAAKNFKLCFVIYRQLLKVYCILVSFDVGILN